MAHGDVESFMKALGAYNRHDLAGFVEVCDPGVESYPATAAAEGGAYRGHEGIKQWFENVHAAFEEIQAEADDVRDLGDRLLALGRVHARGVGSGVEIDTEMAWVAEFRDGRLARWRSYTSHAHALDAAGLGDERA